MLALAAALSPRVQAGSTPNADAFLRLPINAREVALGQAMVALAQDATAFHWNPGGIGMLDGFDAAASYSRLYQGIGNHQMLAAAAPIGHSLAIGLGWVRLGVDDIPYYPSLQNLTSVPDRMDLTRRGAIGHFTYGQNAFFLTFARRNRFLLDMGWQYLTLPMELPVGITVKYLTASAGDSASGSGIGIDLGTQTRFSLGRTLDSPALGTISLGVALGNIGGTRMTWDTPTDRTDKQPMQLYYGGAYEQPLSFIRGRLTGALASTGAGRAWGLEYAFIDQIFLRVGQSLASDSHLAMGAGIGWRGVRLDYALQQHPLGATHRVSLHYGR